jgi:MSHA pilin protein MshC
MLCATSVPLAPSGRISSLPCLPGRQQRARGFSLIELVLVLVVLGVLAVVAAPRIFNTGGFSARGFHDENLALLRYAQKMAVAQRRTVCVGFAANSATLRIASAASVSTCDTDLVGPRGESPGTIVAKSGVGYTATPATLHFDGLGQPMNSSGIVLAAVSQLQVAGSPAIRIEPLTGYVHE